MNLQNNKISCSEHQESGIEINPKTFQIFCFQCETEGRDGTENLQLLEKQVGEVLNKPEKEKSEIILNKEYEISNNNHNNTLLKNDNEKYYFCFKHALEEALFYCDDCSEFICKTCFAVEHRNHSCSTPELMENIIKENVDKLIVDLENLKTTVDANIKTVSELDNFFISQKKEVTNSLKNMNDEIMKNMNLKAKELSNEIENIFNGIDSEVENSSQRLSITKRKAIKILEDFKKINEEVDAIKSDKQICLYKKNKDAVLSENKKFLNDLQLFMNENIEKTKSKSVTGMETFLKRCSVFQKNSEIYENSITNTINSGIPNICMRIRRFRRFFFTSSRYLKTSSLCFLNSHSVNIVGLSLCGLFNNKTQFSKIEFEIKIFELELDQKIDEKKTPVYESKVFVPTILNVVDPVYQFYLNKTVPIHKDKFYYIILNNLDKNSYIDIWTGEINSEKVDNLEQQSIICNNTGVKFSFLRAKGVQSDFDEFSYGLISDIIFSHLD